MKKNIVILLVAVFIGLGLGIVGSWFFMPCPKYDIALRFNIIPQIGDLAIPIPKGYFNKKDTKRWKEWDKPFPCIDPYYKFGLKQEKPKRGLNAKTDQGGTGC